MDSFVFGSFVGSLRLIRPLRRMIKMYKLSSDQLSQQRHYDYGLRAVKSVLVMAGAQKRAQPDKSEDEVLIKAMKDSNVPKFLSDDLPLFQAIVGDLFPGVEGKLFSINFLNPQKYQLS